MTSPLDPPAACQTFRLAADAALAGPSSDPGRADAQHAHECAACAAWWRAFSVYRRRLRAVGEALRAPEGLRARVTALLEAARPSRTP